MKTWTVTEMLVEQPCKEYTRERITELWAGRERLTMLDILDLDIPPRDREWVACRGDLDPVIQQLWIDSTRDRSVRNNTICREMGFHHEHWCVRITERLQQIADLRALLLREVLLNLHLSSSNR